MNNLYEVMGSLFFFFVLAWVLKENFVLISTAVFCTYFAVTLVQSIPLFTDEPFPIEKPIQVSTHRSPSRIIHIILDEHIGIEGIPIKINGGKATQDKIIEFYRSYGFRLFSGAFSRYFQTHYSIPSLMNFSAEGEQQSNIMIDLERRRYHKLLHNTYFEVLAKEEYKINVLAPSYIDYCLHSQVQIQHCYQYNSFKMEPVTNLGIPTTQKINLLLSRYLSKSHIKNKILKKVYLFIRIAGEHIFEMSLPPWSWESSASSLRMHSINTMHILNNLGKSVLAIPPGNAFIVHLLFPHFPYIAHADCSIKNPMAWMDKTQLNGGNTVESREVRYQLYFDQLSCLYSKLDDLFLQMQAAGIYDDSLIIVHGDHGSRISLRDPLVSKLDVLTEEDIIDHFSTLFAVKFPNETWHYDSSPQPLEQLVASVATDLTGFSQPFKQKLPGNFVFLQDKKTLSRFPYPWKK